jgi:hypothetical protein
VFPRLAPREQIDDAGFRSGHVLGRAPGRLVVAFLGTASALPPVKDAVSTGPGDAQIIRVDGSRGPYAPGGRRAGGRTGGPRGYS